MIKSRRVLHVVSSLGMGGAETWLMQILKYQNAHKELDFPKMDFLITNGKKDVFDKEAANLGAQLHYITLDKDSTFHFIRDFRKLLKDNNYAAIHNHQDYLSGWHFLFGLFRLPPVRITHVHNPSYQIYENYGTSFGRRAKLKIGAFLVRLLATHIKGTSRQILKEYKLNDIKTHGNEPSPLYCSFDIRKMELDNKKAHLDLVKEFNLKVDDKIVLFLGRMDYSMDMNHPQNHKNSAFALHICSQLKGKGYKFLFVGANDYILKEFLSLAQSLEVADDIKVLGLRSDVPEIMAASNLLLFPSRGEGLGMVAVEAQAAGLPVLASDSVPKECVVIEELVGFYSLSEKPKNWANKIEEIIDSPAPKVTVSDKRWSHSLFNIEVSAKELKKLYNDK